MSATNTNTTSAAAGLGIPRPAARRSALRLDWLAAVPFIVLSVMFLILPMIYLVIAAFTDRQGAFTLDNLIGLGAPSIVSAYWVSIRISAVTALLGAAFGLAIALAVIRGGLPSGLRSAVMTFSGVASNFAGVPLAFAFIATLGRLGIVNIVLRAVFGVDLFRMGFDLFSFTGLVLTYLYFQIPLMILIIAPAVDGLKKEWNEAAQTLGATPLQFWRMVGIPVLWPSILGTLSLLFANAFGAVATAYALTGSSINIVTTVLYAQIRGDALQNPGLGAALALGMILVASFANVIYLAINGRAERWRR